MASYPSSIATPTTKVDGIDYVLANHVNDLQSEVVAIQTALGTYPATTSTTAMASLTFSNATNTSYGTVKARLENIEAGLYKVLNDSYVVKAGGSIITSSAANVKGLVVTGATSQSANLQEWRTSTGLGAYVDSSANLVNPKTEETINNLYVLSVVFG